MKRNDFECLNSMIETARAAIELLGDRQISDLEDERRITLSLLKSLEMIGHYGSLVSRDCRDACEPVPWKKLIAMKNNMVHAYWDIDRGWIWETVKNDLPELIKALEIVLQPKTK